MSDTVEWVRDSIYAHREQGRKPTLLWLNPDIAQDILRRIGISAYTNQLANFCGVPVKLSANIETFMMEWDIITPDLSHDIILPFEVTL